VVRLAVVPFEQALVLAVRRASGTVTLAVDLLRAVTVTLAVRRGVPAVVALAVVSPALAVRGG